MTHWNVMPRTLLLRILWEGSRNQNRDTQQMGWFFWKKAQCHLSHHLLPCAEWPASSQVRQHCYLLALCPPLCHLKETTERTDHTPGIEKVAVEAISQYGPCTLALPRGQAGPLAASRQQLHEALRGNSCPGHLLGRGPSCTVGWGIVFSCARWIYISFNTVAWPEIRFQLITGFCTSAKSALIFLRCRVEGQSGTKPLCFEQIDLEHLAKFSCQCGSWSGIPELLIALYLLSEDY